MSNTGLLEKQHGRLKEPALSNCPVIDIGREGGGKTQIPEEKHQHKQKC